MKIALIIIAWVLCAGITCGVMMHVDPDEWSDGYEVLCMFTCLLGWPLLAVIGLVYLVMKKLSNIGIFVAGFLDKLSEKKEEQDD